MLRKRIIFTLIYENSYFNQSRNFTLQKVGDINWLERHYKFRDIAFSLDELIILNATKNDKELIKFAKLLEKLVDYVFIPKAAGGGISRIEDAKLLFDSGADKLVINSLLYSNPHIVKQIIKKYGSQSIIASIDYKTRGKELIVLINNGKQVIDMRLKQFVQYVQSLGVGEIYLNSIDRDGTGFGYDFDNIDKIASDIKIPLIIAGGAGNENHLLSGLERNDVDAVATANLLNFVGDGLSTARTKIIKKGINIPIWNKDKKN